MNDPASFMTFDISARSIWQISVATSRKKSSSFSLWYIVSASTPVESEGNLPTAAGWLTWSCHQRCSDPGHGAQCQEEGNKMAFGYLLSQTPPWLFQTVQQMGYHVPVAIKELPNTSPQKCPSSICVGCDRCWYHRTVHLPRVNQIQNHWRWYSQPPDLPVILDSWV